MKRTRGSIRQWAEGVRADLERVRALRATNASPPQRPDPKLEPLEPRILLSADVGLVPDDGLALVALTPELVAPQIEIHDEVLVREASDPDPGERTRVGDLEVEEPLADGEAPGAEAAATAADEADARSSDTETEQGDPGRADVALAELLWSGQSDDATFSQAEEISQLVVIDGRVPVVDSLLASLVESTSDLVGESAADLASVDAQLPADSNGLE
ncbi:MAG: hypothetical protein DRR04_14400, partial [Gammaproteobacteria bacterium]